MKSAMRRSIFREIKTTLNRFLAIFAIVALGVGFFSGLKATTPDMKLTADRYFDETNLMDLRLLSTFGFNEEDIDAIRSQEGIQGVMPSYSLDALFETADGEKALKVHAVPGKINQPVLVEGRLPEKSGECVIEHSEVNGALGGIGDTVKLSSENTAETLDALATHEFTIVGVVETPYYISFERGTTDIGNGKLNGFLMVPTEDFTGEVYTEIFLTLRGAGELDCFGEDYKELVDRQIDKLEELAEQRKTARYDEIVGEASDKLAEAKAELQENEERVSGELADAQQALDDAKAQIEEGETALEEGRQSLLDGAAALEQQRTDFAEQTEQAYVDLAEAKTQLAETERLLLESRVQLDQSAAQVSELRAQAAQLREAGQLEQAQALEAQADAAEEQLSAKQQELQQGLAQVEQGKLELAAQEQALAEAGPLAEEQFTLAQQALDEGQLEWETQRQELESAKTAYQDGVREFQEKKGDANKQLQDARYEIQDAERELRELQKPEWYLLDRDTNPGFAGFGQDADRVDAVSSVFPFFFFLVAALVCLTTMTRMVEEQRTQIGTLKALGYGKAAIAWRYLLYAGLASITGSVVGLLVGFQVFPKVIWHAYGIMYTMPPIITQFNVPYALGSSLAAVLCTGVAAWAACTQELRESPAQLMRPKAPKAGRRVLLERIPFVWRHLGFTQKVTARNLFRYRQRFLMTVLGIGGCAALMLTGFGLKDSITGIARMQFQEVARYQMVIGLSEGGTSAQDTAVNQAVAENTEDALYVMQTASQAESGGRMLDAYLTVPEKPEELGQFYHLRNRTAQTPVAFPKDGSVLLTEKLARELGLKEGDSFIVKKGDTQQVQLTVGGITENYIYHYIYLSPETYESAFGEPPEYKQLLAKLSQTDQEEQQALAAKLLKVGNINSINLVTGLQDSLDDVLNSLNAVVLLLIICANLLAFVVLYNLTNINITERLREIATIKVLGFYDREVSAYVYRENLWLTLFGTALGLVLGIFLHQFVVQTAEVDMVMFERTIKPLSYLWSALLTFLFAGLVNFVMYFRLKKVSMVESLKSIE